MTELVLTDKQVDFLSGDLEERCAKLIELREWVAFASVDDVVDIAERATTFSKIARAAKMAESLRIEASRLEATCMRAVAIHGQERLLPQHQRNAAKWLAEMEQDEFDEFLEAMNADKTVTGYYQTWYRELQNFALDSAYLRAADGEAVEPEQGWSSWEVEQVEAAATALIRNLGRDAETVSTEQAVTRVAEALSIADEVANDSVFREGVKAAVRNAVRHAGAGSGRYETKDGKAIGVPEIVTYYDELHYAKGRQESSSFLRVPWRVAGIDQLLNMVEYREAQAAHLVERAKELRLLHDLLVKHAERTGITKCDELLQRARMGGAIKTVGF